MAPTIRTIPVTIAAKARTPTMTKLVEKKISNPTKPATKEKAPRRALRRLSCAETGSFLANPGSS